MTTLAPNLSVASKYLPFLDHRNVLNPIDSPSLVYGRQGNIHIAYAPFDHVATSARLVVVGITPGLSQAKAALAAAHEHHASGLATAEVLRLAKLTASFSGGAMRANLIAMLDAIGVNRLFSVDSTSVLFTPGAEHVHFTSALRYPVFVDGKNYNGTPDMIRTPILREMIDTHLAKEAELLPEALWLPLGPKAEAALRYLSAGGVLDRSRILAGLPHPSGANAERVAVFLGRKDPALASSKTNPAPLLAAFSALRSQITELNGVLN